LSGRAVPRFVKLADFGLVPPARLPPFGAIPSLFLRIGRSALDEIRHRRPAAWLSAAPGLALIRPALLAS
jgi:hypothetical protein